MQNLLLLEDISQPFVVNKHLPSNFNDYTALNFNTFYFLNKTKSYIPITGCMLEHILTTNNLTNHEKLYYLLVDSLALIGKSGGRHRSASLPSEDWAAYLDCSRSLIFTMQKSLVNKGYFIIKKDWDKLGRNKRNLIIPTLPSSVFDYLNEKYPDKLGEHLPYNPLIEDKRAYLDRTKLFIKLNYNLLKKVIDNKHLSPGQKVIWLSFYTRCYKNYMLQRQEGFDIAITVGGYNDAGFSFIASYQELSKLYSCNTKHLSKSIKALEELGFLKTQNFYIRNKCGNIDDSRNDNYYDIQERQDRSLWNFTLLLPSDCIVELATVKDRANLKPLDTMVSLKHSTVDSVQTKDCLILNGITFNLSSEQASLLKSTIIIDDGCSSCEEVISAQLQTSPTTSDIDSIMEELDLDEEDKLEELDIPNATKSPNCSLSSSSSFSSEDLSNKEKMSSGIKSDPSFAKSRLLYNKNLISKIKDIKSNLSATPKVLFNKFLKNIGLNTTETEDKKLQNEKKEFNICTELVKEALKMLPKDKADKARKFAYSLASKGLATGYAANLSKNELAKQLIHHAASWKPSKLGSVSRDQEIDAALSVAWKAVVGGTWQMPLELAKAEIMQHEFSCYRQKYLESGVVSPELNSLESEVNKLLSNRFIDLKSKIIEHGGVITPTPKVNIVSILQISDDKNHDILPICEHNTKLPAYPEEQEYYLSYNNPGSSDISSDAKDNCNALGCAPEADYTDIAASESYRDKQGNISSQTFDLSNISESQQYLRMVCGEDNNEVIIKTVNDTEYLFKLKSMESNEEGDTVMVLQKVKLQSFIEEANSELLVQTNDAVITGHLSGNSNCFTACDFNAQDPRLLQRANDTKIAGICTVESQPTNHKLAFKAESPQGKLPKTDIYTALSVVFNNLQRKVE